MTEQATLPRAEIRRIFARNRGAAAELARELGICDMTVSLWMRGKTTSARIERAATERAFELLSRERNQQSPPPVSAAAKQLFEQLVADGELRITGPIRK